MIQTEASNLQWREGVERELGLVLVDKETLEVGQVICGGGSQDDAKCLSPPQREINGQ